MSNLVSIATDPSRQHQVRKPGPAAPDTMTDLFARIVAAPSFAWAGQGRRFVSMSAGSVPRTSVTIRMKALNSIDRPVKFG